MKALSEKRNIPSTPIHFHVSIGEDVHSFKTPYYTAMHRLADVENEYVEYVRLTNAIQEADSDAEQVTLSAKLVNKMDSFLSTMGAFVGLYWFHESKDLEANLSDFSDIREYGKAVSRELWEAGYDELDVLFLGGACANEYLIRKHRVRDIEGKKRFFVHPPV